MAQFPNVGAAVSAVQEILQSPYGPLMRAFIVYDLTAHAHNLTECLELVDDRSAYELS